ncbi:MAG: nucleotidyltransferase family protein [Ostreibacterium sp.]
MNSNPILIHKGKTIIEAIGQLNDLRDVSRLILFVIDHNNSVIGSITDGDVRRALLKNPDLNRPISAVHNPDFLFETSDKQAIDFAAYREKDIKILPILDKKKQLVEVLDLEKQYAQLPMECMIMAGGRGQRLSPLTETIPKPMLDLGGMPIIERNIDRLVSFGIKKIYISVKYLGEQIVEHLGDGSSKGISIEYIWEDKPLGTAGALSLVEKFHNDYVLLMNSDLLTNVNFEDLYKTLLNETADMAVASTEYKVDIPYAIFETDGSRVTDFKEKPSMVYHANAGIYILKKTLIDEIPKDTFFDITDLMENLVKSGGKLVYCPIVGYWIDIGKPTDYKQAQDFVSYLL